MHSQTKMLFFAGFLALTLLSMLSTSHCTQFNYGTESEVLRTMSDNRTRGIRDRLNKDFVFGGLFQIHLPDSGGVGCANTTLDRGLERMEAMLFALDLINNDTELLAGLDIGYDIRDTCNSENIGLDEAIDLIITGSQLDLQSCQSSLAVGNNNQASPGSPTLALVGATNSGISVPVASLARLFRLPQISYASTSAKLSDRDRYEYFYRTIIPDDQQARAMIDVLLKFNWTYVSAIYDGTDYGEPWIAEFRLLANEHGICIDLDRSVRRDFKESDYEDLTQLLIKSSANVVILFTTEESVISLLSKIAASRAATRFTWIANDAWAKSTRIIHMFNETAAGLYGITPHTDYVSQFNDYFSQLTINSNKRNPWFPRYFADSANCSLSENLCRKNMALTELPRYEQDQFSPLTIDAVFAVAHALHTFLNDSCQLPVQWDRTNQSCVGQRRELKGSVLLEYIRRLNFVNNITGNRIMFNAQGNVEGKYEILNYQALGESATRQYEFSTVGTWDSSVINDSSLQALTLSSKLQFGIGINGSVRYSPQTSQCGRCVVGQIRRVIQSSCCGLCEPCLGQMYSTDPTSTKCSVCPEGTWGNQPLQGSDLCVTIPESFIRYGDAFSIVVMILAAFGLIAVTATTIVYFIFWKTPVIKSSGREQMITLLIGIGLIFVLAFVYVSPPVPGVCAVQRVGFWVCYSIIFGALLVKIVRVARVFYQTGKHSRVRFTEPYYQVLFTSLIILGQVVIVVIGLIVEYPGVFRIPRSNRENFDDFPEMVVACVVDHVAILVICAVYETNLILLSTILGVMSFKYPENFNEAKFVSFCTFIIAVIWAAFVGLYAYFAIEERQEIQNAITGLASVLSAYAVLACLFGPKLVIVLFRSEQNTPKACASRDLDTDINSTTLSTFNGNSNAANKADIHSGNVIKEEDRDHSRVPPFPAATFSFRHEKATVPTGPPSLTLHSEAFYSDGY